MKNAAFLREIKLIKSSTKYSHKKLAQILSENMQHALLKT